ncbi:MAG: tetratricopeptide repeat protein [bacterium]|nr:tetratricopeptide repeat protein [bacterium]
MNTILNGLLIYFLLFLPVAAQETVPPGPGNKAGLSRTSGRKKLDILVKLTGYYHDIDAKKTLSYGLEALELLRKFPDSSKEIKLLNNVTHAHTQLSHFSEAHKTLDQARRLAQQTGDKAGAAEVLVNRGIIYREDGSYESALDTLDRALKAYEALNHREGIANVTHLIGGIHAQRDNYQEAIPRFLMAARIFEELGDKRKIGRVYLSIGVIYSQFGMIETSLDYLQKSLDISRANGSKQNQSMALHNIAYILQKQGKLNDAMSYLEESLKYYQESDDRRGIAGEWTLMGIIHMKRKEFKQARQYLAKSLEVAKETDDKPNISYNLLITGKLMRQTGNMAWGLSLIKESLRIARDLKIIHLQQEAAKETAEIYESMKQYKKALQFHKLHGKLTDDMHNNKINIKIAELQVYNDLKNIGKKIQLLKNEQEIQQLYVTRQRNLKNFLIVIAVLVFILAIMVYARYRLKSRSHLELGKEMEEHRRTTEELIKSQKMEAVGILAGGIAHDFNNLLTVITGYLDMIKENIQHDTAVSRMVESVERSAQQAAGLADKFVTFSRGGWIMGQRIHLKDILDTTAQRHPELKPLLSKTSLPRNLEPVYGDERQLAEVIFNLLKNADEAAGDPEQITITGKKVSLDESNDYSLTKGDYVKVIITDNGEGIPPDILKNIFDPYFSTKTTFNKKGLGLGLAICYSVINRHKGHISVTSRVGEGTTVELYLPAFRQSAEDIVAESKTGENYL